MIHDILTIKEFRMFLSEPCKEVRVGSKRAETIIRDLTDTANSLRDTCAGLAANQIGYLYRAFAMKQGGHYIVLLNPKIVAKSDKTVISKEGCLSRPGRPPVMVRRHKMVTVEYDLGCGRRTKQKFKGMDAMVAQHEIDHCDGKLI